MASELIQFRLSGAQLEALKALAGEESLNLYVQRIVKDILSTNVSTVSSTPAIEARIEEIVEVKLSESEAINHLQERLEEVERKLGE